MIADDIDKESIENALNKFNALIEENYRIKEERDGALTFILLTFIGQDKNKLVLPQFDPEHAKAIIDYFNINININNNSYTGGDPNGCTAYIAIKEAGVQNSYWQRRTPEEVKAKINDLIEKYENNEI
jgi:hypothetical protein